jgi:GT2 family glycosyltransferase
MRPNVKLAVVIPNHNGGTRLQGRLNQLLAIHLVDRVVLVDDRSTDGSGELQGSDRLSVLKNGGRRGFAATVNVGIKRLLRELEPDYIAVANNDLEYDADFGRALELGTRYLASHPETYLCGFDDALGAGDTAAEAAEGADTNARVVASVAGCLMLFRTSVFTRIGLMSEGYFMYGEENDYFARMKRNGLQLVQMSSSIRHEGEGSGLPGLQTTWLAHRNAVRCAIKTFEARAVLKTLGSLIVLPWFRKPAVIETDPSLRRTLRLGPFVGSALGIASVGWNLLNIATTVRERLAEDRFIRRDGDSEMVQDQGNISH